MRKTLSIFTLAVMLIITPSAFAKTMTFYKEYTYQASEADSKLSCRAIALEQVKRLLLEEIGTYLETQTEVKNYQLTKDQITALTAGIVSAEVKEEKWDGKTYYLKASLTADPDEVAKSVNQLRNDKKKVKELEDAQKATDEALREIETLKKELETTNNQAKYSNAIKKLNAANWYDIAVAAWIQEKYKDAILAFSKAIELNPKHYYAYANRGDCNLSIAKYQEALLDSSRAIELKPDFAGAYIIRGQAKWSMGKHQEAISDFTKALSFDSKLSSAYVFRGLTKMDMHNFDDALDDFRKARELGQNSGEIAIVYAMEGQAYFGKADEIKKRLGIKDLRSYKGTSPGDDPRFWGLLGIGSYVHAARLGNKDAQDYLDSKGILWQGAEFEREKERWDQRIQDVLSN